MKQSSKTQKLINGGAIVPPFIYTDFILLLCSNHYHLIHPIYPNTSILFSNIAIQKNKPIVAYKTIHTSRTIMFAELAKVMDFAIQNDDYLTSLNQNVINKKSQSGIEKTTVYLKNLYSFDTQYPPFRALKYFWQNSEVMDRPKLAILYAIGNDRLLAESIPIITETKVGIKVTVERVEENIEANYPKRYSPNTRRSMAQNIASSWKQAGFITGKIKNIRTQPEISYNLLAFAFLMAYMDGERGDFILTSKWTKALCLGDIQLRELAFEASKRDLLQYQYAGNVTSISFNNFFKKLGIDGI